jgi:hypothetical protein
MALDAKVAVLLLTLLMAAPLTGCATITTIVSTGLKLPSYGPFKHYNAGLLRHASDLSYYLDEGYCPLPIQEMQIIGSLKVNEPHILRVKYAELVKDNPILFNRGGQGTPFGLDIMQKQFEFDQATADKYFEERKSYLNLNFNTSEYYMGCHILGTGFNRDKVFNELKEFAGSKSVDIPFTPKVADIEYHITANPAAAYFQYAESWPSFYWGYWTPHEFKFKITK